MGTLTTHGVNGFLEPVFSASRLADHIIRLRTDRALYDRISAANRTKAQALFDGGKRAGDVAEVYRTVLDRGA